jgi:hypothetical protein
MKTYLSDTTISAQRRSGVCPAPQYRLHSLTEQNQQVIITWPGSLFTQTDTKQFVALSITHTQLSIRTLLTVSEAPGCQSVPFFELKINTQQHIIVQAPSLQKWALKNLPLIFKKVRFKGRHPYCFAIAPTLLSLPLTLNVSIRTQHQTDNTHYTSPDSRTSFHIICSNVKLLTH